MYRTADFSSGFQSSTVIIIIVYNSEIWNKIGYFPQSAIKSFWMQFLIRIESIGVIGILEPYLCTSRTNYRKCNVDH